MVFGGTDLTRAVADAIAPHVVGVVHVSSTFETSYDPSVTNVRDGDLAGWAAENSVPAHHWSAADAAIGFIRDLEPDWGLAAGWYHLLPARLLDCFPLGCAGVHPSLLPKHRGKAPLGWAIVNGDTETGVSLLRFTPRVDDGPLYGQRTFPIGPTTTVTDLIAESEHAAIELVRAAIAAMEVGDPALREQVGDPTYALARTPDDGLIDWTRPATTVDRLVRATTRPYPGVFTHLDGCLVRVWSGEHSAISVLGAPGQIWRPEPGTVLVVTGDGTYRITEATTDSGEDAMPALSKASHRHFGRVRST